MTNEQKKEFLEEVLLSNEKKIYMTHVNDRVIERAKLTAKDQQLTGLEQEKQKNAAERKMINIGIDVIKDELSNL